ncbi:E3 ubiquitin-protein ligase RNF181-like [Lolium rigidum]|uniref:E3 ubiquitin-protein ligase RNF181-like n=1 Tax=Lolium rigidum TaxID=89674 RepID=UPI001F5C8070|nr:E3 ubiquitin-protein ligase RNF181-like [Lolium rigidum]
MEAVRMPTTIIYEEVMEDREPRNGQEFIHRTLMDWTFGRLPWLDEMLDSMVERRREEEDQRQSDQAEEEPFKPPKAIQDNLRETTWAAAGARLQTECAVCLKDFEAEDMVSKMPCDHCFHQGCISQWLRVSCVCPLCRHALPTA